MKKLLISVLVILLFLISINTYAGQLGAKFQAVGNDPFVLGDVVLWHNPDGVEVSSRKCTGLDTPWDCCTGDGTGTCPVVPATLSGDEVEVGVLTVDGDVGVFAGYAGDWSVGTFYIVTHYDIGAVISNEVEAVELLPFVLEHMVSSN